MMKYLDPSSHISVISVSPGYTGRSNRPDILLTMLGSPPHIHLIIPLTAKPSVHSPCSIGRENLDKAKGSNKVRKFEDTNLIF